jgi:four helix bundle protein
MVRNIKELEAYNLSFNFAMDIFRLSIKFPPEEKYSLTDQIRRSSRSIVANISEGWGKRKYVQVFKRHLIDSLGSLEETKTWIQFANSCKYWEDARCHELLDKSDIIGAKIYKLHENWK